MASIKKPTKAGIKMILHEIRRKIWHFWHTNSIVLISKPAKLILFNGKNIENGLDFVDTASA